MPGQSTTPSSSRRNRFPLPQHTPASSSRERTSHHRNSQEQDGIRVSGSDSNTESQRSRAFASASPQKSKFVREVDNDICAVNIRVALRKEDYGEPGSS
eukprot:scaffold48570_cov33-Cyclotella_meneghiniana.AAC.1